MVHVRQSTPTRQYTQTRQEHERSAEYLFVESDAHLIRALFQTVKARLYLFHVFRQIGNLFLNFRETSCALLHVALLVRLKSVKPSLQFVSFLVC